MGVGTGTGPGAHFLQSGGLLLTFAFVIALPTMYKTILFSNTDSYISNIV